MVIILHLSIWFHLFCIFLFCNRTLLKKSYLIHGLDTDATQKCIIRKSHKGLHDNEQGTSLPRLTTPSRPSIKQKIRVGCAVGLVTTGILILLLAILSLRYDYLDLALTERIKMHPGLPPYDKWVNSTGVEFRVKLYLFSILNPNEFLNGTDKVLRLKQIGPISYRNKMRQEDVVFHEKDSTLSYTTTNELEFIENEHDPGFLNQSVIILNPMLLLTVSLLHGNFFGRFASKLLAANDHVFIERTIYEILWNYTTPVLENLKRIPFLIPRTNPGIMYNSFYHETIRYNVNVGTKHGYDNFFKINTLNGGSKINILGYDFPKHCPYSVKGATDGTGIPPYITKDTVLHAYNKNLCRTYPLTFNRTLKYKGSIDAYVFSFSNDIYKRNKDPHLDCFKQTGTVRLPDGLIDSSRCAFGMPVSVSNPHFWGFRGEWENYIDGLNPNSDDHKSHLTIEPKTGIPLEAVARMQLNYPMPLLEGYPKDIQRFSNMILPAFWMELNVYNSDPLTLILIQIAANYLPILQSSIIVILFFLSIFLLWKGILVLASVSPRKRNISYSTVPAI